MELISNRVIEKRPSLYKTDKIMPVSINELKGLHADATGWQLTLEATREVLELVDTDILNNTSDTVDEDMLSKWRNQVHLALRTLQLLEHAIDSSCGTHMEMPSKFKTIARRAVLLSVKK